MASFLYALTSSNINRFSKLFHCQNQEKTCNNTILKIPLHLKCVTTLPCEMSSVSKQQLKTRRLLLQHILKKLQQGTTCLLSQLMSKVTHMLQFLHQLFNLFALLRDTPLKPVTPLTNGAIDETFQKFAPLSDDCLL